MRMNSSTRMFFACTAIFFGLASCSGGGSGGGAVPLASNPAGSVAITGTVSGTVIKVLNVDTNTIISQFDTAGLNQSSPFPFSLTGVPTGTKVRLFFITGGAVYPLYFGTPTNVFKFTSTGNVDLGTVTTANGQATLQVPPTSGVQFEPPVPDLPIPFGIEPPPPTITISGPVNDALVPYGPVDITFTIQNITIGDGNHDHLHVYVDSDVIPYEFEIGAPGQIFHNGAPAQDAQWISSNKFRLLNLSPAPHRVTLTLATASHAAFVNSLASKVVNFSVDQPAVNPPATVAVVSPTVTQAVPFGPVSVTFAVSNFTVQGQGQPQLHFYLDSDSNPYQFLNGSTNSIWYEGVPTLSVLRENSNTFTFPSLTAGSHIVRVVLASGDSISTELTNPGAATAASFTVNLASGGNPRLSITNPNSGASVPAGPVLVTFDIQNSPVSPSATQPRMHFYVDNDPVVYQFYVGPGVAEEGNLSGVRYHSVHTHAVHWKSASSIQLNGLASGLHSVRFVLVDQAETELVSTDQTLSFVIQPGIGGAFSLQEVVGGLDFSVAMASAPDGRIFVSEFFTGNIRVVTPTASLPWQLQVVPFATLPIVSSVEAGLLGIAVDPNFSQNGFVYVFYTASGPVNRVVRFKATTSNGNTVAEGATPILIFDNIPAATTHNGGVIHFGPDGKLYIFVGENDMPTEAQSLSTLRGKILRINPDGSIPSDNPFSSLSAPYSAIYSRGHRNSFGFTFHSHTNDLWETENGEDDNDQINRIVAGGNYGWPIVSGTSSDPQFINPIITFTPTIAPTGVGAIGVDSAYPAEYHNNLMFTDFNNGQVHRIVLGGAGLSDLVSHTVACNCGVGYLFDVMQGLNVPGQDGYLYVKTVNGISRLVLN